MNPNPENPIPNPKARSITFPTDDRKRVQLLAGPPESCFLKSGYVKLTPGEAVGLHSTQQGEEVIIPVSGKGELAIKGSNDLSMHPGLMAYIPPGTEHDVINTGNEVFVYVYVVTRPEKAAES